MFSNLSKGSILYVLQTKDTFKLSSGTITEISLPRPRYTTVNPNNVFGQPVETVVDIVATIDGERREFKQVPGNLTIANFGPDSIVLSDSRESMLDYSNAMRQNSENIISSVEKHKELVKGYTSVIKQLNPYLATNERNQSVEALENKVNGLEKDMKEILKLLKEK